MDDFESISCNVEYSADAISKDESCSFDEEYSWEVRVDSICSEYSNAESIICEMVTEYVSYVSTDECFSVVIVEGSNSELSNADGSNMVLDDLISVRDDEGCSVTTVDTDLNCSPKLEFEKDNESSRDLTNADVEPIIHNGGNNILYIVCEGVNSADSESSYVIVE